MNLNRRLEPLPELDINLPERHQTLLLAAVLIVGLTFVSPLLSLLTGIPALVFVVVVGLLYGTLAVLFRQVLAGSLVGLLVTSSFMANVPLTSNAHLATFPGHLGPALWLAQIPLVVSVALVFLTEPREVLAGATRAEGLFTAFVGWTVLAALFGATERVDTALYFSFLMFQGLIVFTLLRYAIQKKILSFGSIVQVFVGTVLAQCLFAVAQFFNGGIFGVSTLGEFARKPIAPISLGPLGEFATGTYVSGFTGMSFLLASLITLAVPLAIVLAINRSGWMRMLHLGASLVMMAVLRVTGTDAGRGAAILALVCLCVALVYSNRSLILDWITGSYSSQATTTRTLITNVTLAALTTLTSFVALFYPSSASGSSSSTTKINGVSTTGNPAGGTSTGGGSSMANTQPGTVESILQELSIPLFDIGSLGIRLQQYVIGVDLFLKHPLFGIGGANFLYYSTEYGLTRTFSLHNIYIAVLAETGFPGFLLFVALLGTVLWYGWNGTENVGDGLLLIGLLCGIAGYLAFGFWDYFPITKTTSFFPFWVLVGAMAGKHSQNHI